MMLSLFPFQHVFENNCFDITDDVLRLIYEGIYMATMYRSSSLIGSIIKIFVMQAACGSEYLTPARFRKHLRSKTVL